MSSHSNSICKTVITHMTLKRSKAFPLFRIHEESFKVQIQISDPDPSQKQGHPQRHQSKDTSEAYLQPEER